MSQGQARLIPGDEFTTSAIDITEEMRADLVRIGGYTHPLFSRPGTVSLPAGSPVPGQGVLLLMGGLVEQSGRLDDAVVLMGLADVTFRRPAVPGSRVAVRVEVIAETPHRSKNCVRTMHWTAVDGATVLVTATAAMLVRPQPASAS
jgi:3-hydroxymyristoyl/3-hydroxydecanoyl-(acyl carrier protein) dehydratase